MIAARVRVLADIAGAFDIAIGQEALLALAVEQGLFFLVEIAALQQPREDVARHLMMVLGVGMGEEIITDADFPLRLQEALVIVLEDFQRRLTALVRLGP